MITWTALAVTLGALCAAPALALLALWIIVTASHDAAHHQFHDGDGR